jgi:hypothetical protein
MFQSSHHQLGSTPSFPSTMIDRHYGHLARDGREHAIQLLDALNAPEFDPWRLALATRYVGAM